MSGETGVVVRRRGRAEIAQVASSYRSSGLGRSEFCRRHGLALSTLNRHLQRQFEEDARRDNDVVGRGALVEVKLAEVLAYPTQRGKAVAVTGEGAQRYATPLQIATHAALSPS